MQKNASRGPRLFCLFALGVLLFNYPLLALFNLPRHIFGVPLLYAYLFIVWALLILLVARVVDRPERG